MINACLFICLEHVINSINWLQVANIMLHIVKKPHRCFGIAYVFCLIPNNIFSLSRNHGNYNTLLVDFYINIKHGDILIYKQQEPIAELKNCIKSFWLIDSEGDKSSFVQKIIPDGYPELIFHYKSTFRANISGEWFLQDKYLVAGQIRNHFFLENTGEIGMFGIKLQPWTLKLLFNIDINLLTDMVISIADAKLSILNPLKDILINEKPFESKVEIIENWFIDNIDLKNENISKGQNAVQYFIDKNGEISIQEVLEFIDISQRSLERYFKAYIGLTPKFYSRIIRFTNVFKLVKAENFNWSDIAYLAGFYDQSHFIKNFKEFTGEEPSGYGFDEQNMANFFLKK